MRVVWSGSIAATRTGTTNASGVVTFASPAVRKRVTSPTFTVTVSSVSRTGYVYDEGTPSRTVP